ncbi:MAG: glycosyltransferase family 2 protein, partial [Bacteroidota bacterium]
GGRFTEHRVHERLHIDGTVRRLKADLLHFTDPTLHHYFEKLNRYTGLASDELIATGKRFAIHQLLIRPPWTFLKMYVLKLGFLDGIPGFILCVLSACYVFTKYAKLWERKDASGK